MERQATVMRKELDAYRDEGTSSREPRLLYETTAPFGKDIPTEYQSLVRPGRWSVYKLNHWKTEGDGVLVHQDKLVKLIPPQLYPRAQNLSGSDLGLPDMSSGLGGADSTKVQEAKLRGETR